MPFIREGLCATDQRKCAKLLEQGMSVEKVAAIMRTTPEYAKKFTTDALDAFAGKSKKIEEAAIKHQNETRTTAAALAGAAKELLGQRPPADFE